jgi:hypothetical protein
MSPGNTTTGSVLESIMKPTLEKNGYTCAMQQVIGSSIRGRPHRVDVLVQTSTGYIPISVKWQQVSGTAEEKVPYEIIKLIHAIRGSEGRFPYAYLVLGGTGWTMKDFYLGHGLRDYIRDYDLVRLLSLEDFITRANKRAL